MRYLAFLFTIFVVALSVWPCCDDETKAGATEQHLSQSGDCGSNENPHACSPFFHCGACQSFAIAPSIELLNTSAAPGREIQYIEIPAARVVLFPGDIWQPPQLA